MKEPQRRSMATGLPEEKDNLKIPMPSLYPEPMSDDVYSTSNDEGFNAEKSFLKFIADQGESRKKYQERLKKIRNETNQN